MTSCGDGVLNLNEECDDSNNDDFDGCSMNCLVEIGYICSGAGAGSCSLTLCGNGVIDVTESCDD